MWRPFSVLMVAAVVMGCAPAPQGAGTAPSGGPGAGQLPRDTFPMNNARVVSQSGVNTAIVETTRGAGFPDNASAVRVAAQEWCGAPAQVTRISSSRSGFSNRHSYLVRCG